METGSQPARCRPFARQDAAGGQNRAPAGNRPDPDNRAAQAAARVAERFAHASSYNEALADEARAVVRAAKAASRAAEEAHAAAEYVLAGLEAVSGPQQAPSLTLNRTGRRTSGLSAISSTKVSSS